MFLNLNNGLVRPHLEYGSAAWAVKYKREKVKIENIQRRATKLLPEINLYLSYNNRLRTLAI